MSNQPNDRRDKLAEEYTEEFFKMNPNGCTVATYVNGDVLTTAFEAGWNARDAEIERLRDALKHYSSESMRLGSTITPKWADEALAGEPENET